MQVIVDKHTVTIVKNEIVNEGEYNVQSCNFQFSSDYDGLPKIAIFKTNAVTKQIMLSGNTCITPEEVLQTTGIVGLGVYAYQTDGDNLILRYSPTPAVFTVEPGSYDEGDAPTPPTPSVIEQLQEEITQNANNITSLENVTDTHTTQIGTLQTDVNNIKTEQITQNTNIQTNANDISNIKAEQITQNNKIAQNTSDIATLNNNLTNYSLITETGSQIVLNVNPSNYQMTAILKDKNGNIIYTSNVIDLPIESMIVNVTYDSTTKEIVFTLQNGTTLRVSVADLVSGLVSTDELNTILASYYTKTEIDNLLSGKVDTTTYTQEQATQDANIEENASNIDWLQTLVNQMPTVSGQGTDLSLESVLNYRLMKFLPQGVSSQAGEPTPTTPIPVKSVTGENSLVISSGNLFDKNSSLITNNRRISTSTGGSYSSNGYSISPFIEVKPDTQYNLTSGIQSYYCWYDENEQKISGGTWNTGESKTSPSNVKYVKFDFQTSNIDTIMIVIGSTAPTTYVEYEEQNYQLPLGNIELNSSPDGTIRDGIIGSSDVSYNLLDYTQWASGSILDDGSESTNVFNAKSTNYILVAPNTTYSFLTNNNITSLRLNEYTNNKVHVQRIVASSTNKLTITTTANTHYLRWSLNYNNATTITEELLKGLDLMLIKGSEVKPYFPYGQVGMWYKREYIGKVVLDGSDDENWSISTSPEYTTFYTSIIDNYLKVNKNICYCDLFKSKTNVVNASAAGSTNNTVCFRYNDNLNMLYLTKDDITTATNFKSWLATNNIMVWYAKSEYTDIPITDTTLINQLNNIYNNAHSYNGTTNITTTYEDGNEQMYLDIEALAKGGSTTTETDPIFSASASSGITSSDITNWNGKASTTYVDTAIANAITNTLGGSF